MDDSDSKKSTETNEEDIWGDYIGVHENVPVFLGPEKLRPMEEFTISEPELRRIANNDNWRPARLS